MLISHDFRKLAVVCLKMLFRKSTRKRFICLVMAFLFMMSFNIFSYVMQFHKTEKQKKEIVDDKTFKVFFLRLNTKEDCARFLMQHRWALQNYDAEIVEQAFIYQNNLYISMYPSAEIMNTSLLEDKDSLSVLYSIFNISTFAKDFYVDDTRNEFTIKFKDAYVDYNGAGLNNDIITQRDNALKSDIIDISNAVWGNIAGKRLEVFNLVRDRIVKNIKRVSLDKNIGPNPYLSRLGSIIPMNILNILTHIYYDNTTDIIDLSESVIYTHDATIEMYKAYSDVPEVYSDKLMYEDVNEIFPRYLPLYIPNLLQLQWNWLLYQNIHLNIDFIDYIDQLHFQGHFLFSYEKLNILKDCVKKINDDIHTNHIHFYLTDLSLGIAFPFMLSLFAFIHLKTEIAFLLMFKNRIRELLFIFWLLPIALILVVKGGILIAYFSYLFSKGFLFPIHLIAPLLISFLFAAMVFWQINKWCFREFTDNNLNLYTLHKGR